MGSRVKNNNSVVVTELAQSVVPTLRGAELAISYLADRHILYDFVRVSPNRVLFGLLDVTRGVSERSIVSAAQDTFRARAAELFVGEEINEADAMIELSLHLNRSILKAAGAVCSSPSFAGCYNEDLGTVCYFNAGHSPGLVRDGTGLIELAPTGLPLGLFSHVTSDARIVALQPAAILALVSGKVFEIENKEREPGFDRVKQSLQQAEAEGAHEICQALLRGVQSSMAGPAVSNIAALALVRRP
jgi:serine phosphatase RsbU (regulator of sigma subunit)